MANKGRRPKRAKVRLIVDSTIRDRLLALLPEKTTGEGELDRLLERMIEVYEERKACPRGAIR